jgi:hypothetical protein
LQFAIVSKYTWYHEHHSDDKMLQFLLCFFHISYQSSAVLANVTTNEIVLVPDRDKKWWILSELWRYAFAFTARILRARTSELSLDALKEALNR